MSRYYNSVVVIPTINYVSGVATNALDIQYPISSLNGGTLRAGSISGIMDHPVSSGGSYTALYLDITARLGEFATLKQFLISDLGLTFSSSNIATDSDLFWFMSLRDWVNDFSSVHPYFSSGFSQPANIVGTQTSSSIVLKNQLGDQLISIDTGAASFGGGMVDINIKGIGGLNIPTGDFIQSPPEFWTRKKPAQAVKFSGAATYANFDDDATAIINFLGAGLNIGQEWDAIKYGDKMPGAYRSVFTTPELFRRIKASGFDHVRIPCNFSNFTDVVSPWGIDQQVLDKYFESVDNALSEGLMVIVDNHHHKGFLNVSSGDSRRGGSLPRSEQLIRQSAMVVQVAQRLNSYDFNKVLFELENEPNTRFNSDWNTYWPPMLSACRAANQNTIFLIGGTSWNNSSKLAEMPEITDTRTALVAHTYEPHFTFTHNTFSGGDLKIVWDNDKKEELAASLDVVKAQVELRGKPCVMTEGGVRNLISLAHKNMYARDLRNLCFERGISFSYWNATGDFAIMSTSGYFTEGTTEAITGKAKDESYDMPQLAGSNMLALDEIKYSKSGMSATLLHDLISKDDEPVMTFSDDTITVVSGMPTGTAQALVIPYAVTKKGLADAPKNGRAFRLTFGCTNSSARMKIRLEEPNVLGAVSGYRARHGYLPFPNGAGEFSTPKWGDHPPGVYEYECYLKTEYYWLKDMALLSFIMAIDRIVDGDVITLKIEWLD